MTDQFAKIFDTHHGQVLVKLDEDENGPEVRFYMKPPELGVCSMAFNFADDDKGWEQAGDMFNKLEADRVEDFSNKLMQAIVDEAREPEIEIEFRGI